MTRATILRASFAAAFASMAVAQVSVREPHKKIIAARLNVTTAWVSLTVQVVRQLLILLKSLRILHGVKATTPRMLSFADKKRSGFGEQSG
jgi:hypothetical protein